MRVSREQAEKNRQQVIDVASRLFRERGFEGVGIADIMKSAGLTHGGFYGQFQSKDHLVVEAEREALTRSLGAWRKVLNAAQDRDKLGALADFYLTSLHRRGIARGCPLAALGPDIARAGVDARRVFQEGLAGYLDLLVEALPGGDRSAAIVLLSTMVGALTLSRAVEDDALGDEILAAAAAALRRRAEP